MKERTLEPFLIRSVARNSKHLVFACRDIWDVSEAGARVTVVKRRIQQTKTKSFTLLLK